MKHLVIRHITLVCCVFLFVVYGQKVYAAQHVMQTIAVLPFKVKNAQNDTLGMALGVQQILEDILLLHPKMSGKPTHNLINTIFYPKDSFDDWSNGTDNSILQRAITLKKYDIIFCGELDGSNNQVTLTIINAENNQKNIFILKIDNTYQVNKLAKNFITVLGDAGFQLAENHRNAIYYNETITKNGLFELGMLYKDLYIHAINADSEFSFKKYEKFLEKEKSSYLALTLMGHVYEHANIPKKSKKMMDRAVSINKSGYDALKYLEFYGYSKGNIREGVLYSAKLFKARNMENDNELYSGLTNYYEEISTLYDEKSSNAILNKICDYLTKEIGKNEAITLYFYTVKLNKLRHKAHDLYANGDKLGAFEMSKKLARSLEILKQTDEKEIIAYIESCIIDMMDLATACTQENKYNEGVQFYDLATNTLKKFVHVDARNLIKSVTSFVNSLISIGKHEQARSNFDEYIDTISDRGHFDTFSFIMPYTIKANVSYAIKKNKKAYDDCVYAFNYRVNVADIDSDETIDIFLKIIDISNILVEDYAKSNDNVAAISMYKEVNKLYTMMEGYISPTKNLSVLLHLANIAKYNKLDDSKKEHLQQAFQHFKVAVKNDHHYSDSFSSDRGKDSFFIAGMAFSIMLNDSGLQEMCWKVIDDLTVFVNTYAKNDQKKQYEIQNLYATNFVNMTVVLQEIPKTHIVNFFNEIKKYKGKEFNIATYASIHYNEQGKPALAKQFYDSLIEQSQIEFGHDNEITHALLLNASHALFIIENYNASLEYITLFLDSNGDTNLDEKGKLEFIKHISSIYCALGNYKKALDILDRYILEYTEKNGKNSLEVAKLIKNVSKILVELGDFQQARVLDEHVLEVFRKELGEENKLTVSAYLDYGYLQTIFFEYEQAEITIKKAIDISQKVYTQDSIEYARGLQLLAQCLARKNDFKQALDIEQKSEKIYKKLLPESNSDRLNSQQNIAVYLSCLGQKKEALALLQDIFFFAVQSQDVKIKTAIMANMAALLKGLGKLEAAIFLNKICANDIQDLRKNALTMETIHQKTLMFSNKHIFENLISALTQQGRLLEAQIVLNIIKDEELFDFVVRSGRDISTNRIEFIGPERMLYTKFIELEKKVTDLPVRGEPSHPMTSALRQELLDMYNTWHENLASLNPKKSDAALKAQLGLQDHLKPVLALMQPGTVLLHTIMTEDTLWILATTPGGELPVARKTAISYKDLSIKIRDFRQMLVDRAKDPRPLAKELYDALITPVQDILDKEQTHTLLLSLDGPLRYIPPAALHDGTQWLAQKYAVSIFTEAARESLRSLPTASGQTADSAAPWRVAGLGVTKGHGKFSPLPAVAEELAAIVQSPENPHASLQGEYVLDEDFTAARMQQLLHKKYPVVHVATHFEFNPGTVHTSYVLTGDGQQLTLAQLKGEDFPFAGVDQLTLSACNTAMTAASSGSEVEGFGALAQRKGAQTVLATLWPVADASTGALMARYYKEKGTDSSKAEALRRAQRACISGTLHATDSTTQAARGKAATTIAATADAKGHASFPGFSHPYFWAPFILMGNWQ